MKFYSGFSLSGDEYLFSNLIDSSEYCVCGFSYGSIKAFEETLERLKNSKRVDRLQLFSPAFFQTKNEKFKRLQLLSFSKNKDAYLEQFLNSCFLPYEKKIVGSSKALKKDLESLLNYEWELEGLKYIAKKGVAIEVYLGGKDTIIDVQKAREFFKQIATVTYIRDANHFLQTN